ncbi:MAG: Hsp20/alpha crystallin family protein [Desulfovibrionaceae bacterium]|nr:Hsp20/alpha crystallin family protein [Desulfovibrionaceae bacterium]
MFDIMTEAATSPFGLLASLAPARARSGMVESDGFIQPRMSIEGDEHAWRVALEVPGVEEKELNVEMKENTLIISGEKKFHAENMEKGVYHMERSFGSFRRVIAVPEDVQADAVSASCRNGVLEVVLPRAPKEKEQPRKIEITQG